MKNSFLKKVVMTICSALTFIMVLFIRVDATNTLVIGEDFERVLDAGNSSYFTFLKDASVDKSFILARVFMWVGFILVALCVIYFIVVLFLSLMNKNELVNKLDIVTKIVQIVLTCSVILILLAGIDKKVVDPYDGMAVETLSITLFGVPALMALASAISTIACQYLIKE